MMNYSQKNHRLLVACNNSKTSHVILNNFFLKTYEHNGIALLVVNCILFFLSISLNAISVITIRKLSQLRIKVCYFVIALQSVVDFTVGIVNVPFFIYYLVSPLLNTTNYTFVMFALGIAFLPCGFSVITHSAMTTERYVGVLHP